MPGAYERLLELARRERDALEAGDWERLRAVQIEQCTLREALAGVTPPRSARLALEEAARLNADVVQAIQRAMAGLQAELVALGRGREAAVGYGGATGAERMAQAAWEG